MWLQESDVPGNRVVLDLEWLGNSLVPHTTQLTQIAARHIESDRGYESRIQPIASQQAVRRTNKLMGVHDKKPCDLPLLPLRDAMTTFLRWLMTLGAGSKPMVLIAHNGIRYDAPVLLNAFAQCGMCVPPLVWVMDSLHHVRYQLRHQSNLQGYDLDSLAEYFGIGVDKRQRHKAIHDVTLLCTILRKVQEKCGCPFITGLPNFLSNISCMVIRGVGPVVCEALGNVEFRIFCDNILRAHGDLSQASCMQYLENAKLRDTIPLVNLPMIASSVARAAKSYLQYIE